MSDPSVQLQIAAFLTPTVRAFLGRCLTKSVGGGLIAFGLFVFMSLISHAPMDPSFNSAADGPVRNLAGPVGAIISDLALQGVGLAAFLLPVIVFAWGCFLLGHKGKRRLWVRLAIMPIAILLLSVALAAAPVPASWPLATGLGGVAGELVLHPLVVMANASPRLVALCAAVAAIASSVVAVGLPLRAYIAVVGRASGALDAGMGRIQSLYLRLWDATAEDVETARLRADRIASQSRARQELVFSNSVTDPCELEVAPAPQKGADGRSVAPPVSRPKGRSTKKNASIRQTALDLLPDDRYELPPLDLLDMPPASPAQLRINDDSLQKNARLLESVLDDFGVKGQIVQLRPGPVVTLYELEPAPGTKTSRVVGLADDIARSMSALSVRIAVVPGRSVIGIELPNRVRETVYLRDLLSTTAFERTAAQLALVLGKDIGGTPVVVDLARMPHLLIAGTTGSGKSVAINTMIMSLIYRLPPDVCKFIMIDPKMLELSVYDGIPHLLSPVVTDPRKAIVALKWTVREMEQRYRAMSKLGVRNIEGYNLRIAQARQKGEALSRKVQTGFDPDTGAPIFEEEPLPTDALPFIVVIVDEMADLMLVAGKEIEAAIQRLAQMARAAGIHIIMATQRPSVDVITGTIKANFPTRISFQVTSRIDSRTILSETGAEQLLGQGDMLHMASGGRITRVHGPLVTDREVETVVRFLKKQGEPTYIEDVTREDEDADQDPSMEQSGTGDALYDQAVALVCREGKASTSFIQRHLQIGYNRAARIVERMEKEGVVSSADRVGKREVLARNIEGME